nr:MATH domain and coiled-coil domain-containing protein At2g05420-like [Coffea arabica]
MNKEWGIARLLSQNVFNDSKKGYLIQDKCMFGVEIFANRCTGRGECLAFPEKIDSIPCTWKVNAFSALSNATYSSDEFTMGSYKWKLLLYPKGDCTQEGRRNLSIFLTLADMKTAARVHAKFTLSIENQKDKEHKKFTGDISDGESSATIDIRDGGSNVSIDIQDNAISFSHV